MLDEKKFFVAGVQHHEINKVLDEIQDGDDVELVPEPNNKFDSNAVRIEYAGTMIGYVPKKFSADVAAALQIGAEISAFISSINKSAKPWEMCEVELLIDTEDVEEKEEEEDLEEFLDEGYDPEEDR